MPAGGFSLDSVFGVGSNPVALTILLTSLFCGSFWGLSWFNPKVEFSLFRALLVTTSFARSDLTSSNPGACLGRTNSGGMFFGRFIEFRSDGSTGQ